MVSNKIYVGIDFGTTHSGFSYTFDGAEDEIFFFSDWPGLPQPYPKDKTCILYEKEKGIWNAIKYGYSAYQYYTRNVAAASNFYFVERFKLLLDPNSNIHIELPTGLTRERLLKDYLGYMKYYVKLVLELKLGKFENLNISWYS